MGTAKRSRNPKTVITANGEVQTSEEAQVCKSSMTRLRSCHLASSAKNTVIPTSGPVSKATLDQTKEEDSLQDGKFRTSCCPRMFFKLRDQFVLYVATAGLVKYIFMSSNREVTNPHQETGAIHQKRKIKRGMTIEHREVDCETFQNRWRTSQKISNILEYLHPYTCLMTQIRNVPQKGARRKHSIFLTSQEIEIAKYACEPREQGLLGEDALAKQYLEQKSFANE